MVSSVFGCGLKQIKVVRIVVSFYFVDMMYNFLRVQRSSKNYFRNENMHRHVAFFVRSFIRPLIDIKIAVVRHVYTAFPVMMFIAKNRFFKFMVTVSRAVFSSNSFARPGFEVALTNLANNIYFFLKVIIETATVPVGSALSRAVLTSLIRYKSFFTNLTEFYNHMKILRFNYNILLTNCKYV